MSIKLYTLGYPRTDVREVGTFGWDPTWQNVDDIKCWASRHSVAREGNVEVYASGKMLSQLSRVKSSFGLIEVRPRHPIKGEGDEAHVSELEVFVY